MKRVPFARDPRAGAGDSARVSLARALSKLGACSRAEGARAIALGRVRVDGAVVRDPSRRISMESASIEMDGVAVTGAAPVHLMLNKPRGLVTTARDESGRETVYHCLEGADLPWLSPVGRLDRASEGLLLLTNDTRWAARLTEPGSGVDKVYHVRLRGIPTGGDLDRMRTGVVDRGERLAAKAVRPLRAGEKNAWLEVVLDEGRNRHIRRLLAELGFEVLRLVRVAVGPLTLGDLPRGEYRPLTPEEVSALSSAPALPGSPPLAKTDRAP